MSGIEVDRDAERGEDELPEGHLVVGCEDLLPAQDGGCGAVFFQNLRGRMHDGLKQQSRVLREVLG